MKPLEIVSELSGVVNDLYDLSKVQQAIIESAKIPESEKRSTRERLCNITDKLDIIEFHSRGVIDTDDGESISEEVKLYEVTVKTEHKLMIEATGRKSAIEQAEKEFIAMTHIKPKEIFVGNREKGETDDD